MIHGREVGFRMTVGAQIELCKLCPGGDINRLAELLDEKQVGQTMETVAKIVAIMSKADSDACAYEDGVAEKPLTYEEALTLTPQELMAAQAEAMAAFTADSKPTVEVKPGKNAGAGAAESEA